MLIKLARLLFALPLYGFSQISDSAAFFSDKPIYPYYYTRSANPHHDFRNVKRIYREKIESAQIFSAFSGVITIYFYVNYQGEAGFFSIQAVDENYAPVPVPQNTRNPLWRISDVILNTTQQYFSAWTPVITLDGLQANMHKFYSFRFQNGVLSEIFPK